MITPSLLTYIEQSLAAGKRKEQIVSDLRLAGGWDQADVEEAFLVLQKPPYTKTVKSRAGSFFIDVIIVIVILGGLAFAADKFDAPLVNNLMTNIAAVLPFNHPAAPVATTPTNAIPDDAAAQNGPSDDSLAAVTQTPDTGVDASSTPVVTPPPALVACANNDSNCLIQAASSCNPANEQNTTKTSKDTSTRFYAVIGQQANECVFSFSIKSDSSKITTGKGGLCNFSSTDDLVTVLNHWKVGNFTADNAILTSQCTGNYFGN